MSVQELSDLHRRYVDLSQRFRAAWVFHQLLQSLARIDDGEVAPSPFAARFQELYNELKEASQSLTPGESGHLPESFDRLGGEIETLLSALLAEDSKVGPNSLRHFFQKFRNYDEKILAQLTRFYLFACDESEWTTDRRDKVDFLVTRLGMELRRTDEGPGGGTSQQGEIFSSFWKLVGDGDPPREKVDAMLEALTEIRGELEGVTTLEQLTESDSLRNFREFKHSLGNLFFYPAVLNAVLETNLTFRETVRRLYQKEEQRIAADYQRIFDLEREVPVDYQLDQELTVFRQQVERFERRLQEDEMRLDDLVELRERARSLIPRLSASEGTAAAAEEGGDTRSAVEEATVNAALEAMADGAALEERGGGGPPELIRESYSQLLEALGETTMGASARSVALSPEVYALRLEARAVVAFRRLHEGPAGRSGAPDVAKEETILQGAALRVRVREEVDLLAEALDDVSGGGDEVARARSLVGLADAHLRRYDHLQERSLLDTDVDEARSMLLLRVRLMREYSELWLLAHQEIGRGGEG